MRLDKSILLNRVAFLLNTLTIIVMVTLLAFPIPDFASNSSEIQWTLDSSLKSDQSIPVSYESTHGIPTDSSGNAYAGNPVKIAFTSPTQTIMAGLASSVITLQIQDETGGPSNVPADTIVNLTSNSNTGRFDISPSGSFDGSRNSVTIAISNNSASFYYKDITSGTPIINANSIGMAGGTQQQTITSGPAAAISISTSPIAGASVDTPFSTQPVIIVKDQYNNPVNGARVTASRISDNTANYTLTLKIIGQGTISPAPGTYQKPKDSQVTISAAPAYGWHFSGWVGNISSITNKISFTITQNCTVTAVFETGAPTDTLLYSVEQSSNSYAYLYGHKPFTDAIEKATFGAIKTTIYPGSSLIKSTQNWEGVKSGIADMGWIGTNYYAAKFPLAEVNMLPFMFPDAAVGSKVSWEIFNKYPELQSQWQENKILSTMTSEPYFLVSRNKYYRTIEDWKGIKIRAMGYMAHFVSAVGGAPVAIALPECYIALEKGVVDAMLIDAETYVNYKIYQVAPYITHIPTACNHYVIAMNLATWNSYPKNMQDQIMSVSGAYASNQFGSVVFEKSRTEMVPIIQAAGSQVYEYTPSKSEKQRMVLAVEPLWDKWVTDQVARGFTRAQQILDDTLALSQQYSGGSGGSGGDSPASSYSLNLKVIGEGVISPGAGSYTVSKDNQVFLNALPNTGWQFSGWVGSLSGFTNTISFSMIQNYELTAVFEPIDNIDEILRGNLTIISNASGTAAFTNLGYNRSGEVFSLRFNTGNLSVSSGSLGPLNTGMAANIRVESAANGSGHLIPAQLMITNTSLTAYGIVRDQCDNFIGNPDNTSWSLINKTGGIADTDLSAANGSSVVFTGHKPGTTVINASITGLTSIVSGTITVVTSLQCGQCIGNVCAGCGGGGPGGGGAASVLKPVSLSGLTSSVDLKVDVSGFVQTAAQLKLEDGSLILEIPKNTQLVGANSKALETLTGSRLSTLPASPPGAIIVSAYELGPEGAQFNSPLTLTLKFDSKSLPAGSDASKITLGFWDGSKWVLVDSALDTAFSTLTAKISHFSQYALLAPLAPAKFTLSDLKITEDKASPDNPVTIQTTISNEGGSPGSYTAIFILNSVELNKKEITLEAGKSQPLSFTLKNLVPGKYFADINGQNSHFVIEEPSKTIALNPPVSETTINSVLSPVPATEAASLNQSSESKPTFSILWIMLGVIVVLVLVTGIILIRQRGRRSSL